MQTPTPSGPSGARLRIGTAGWSYPDWEGLVYPRGGGDRLVRLARWFDVMEVNTSFYRLPQARHVDDWVRRTEAMPDHRFVFKLWRGLTHDRPDDLGPVSEFLEAIGPARDAGRLGGILIQFPHSFRPDRGNRDYLARLLDRLEGWPCAVETRRESWMSEEPLAVLRRRSAAVVNVDQPLFDDSLAPSARLVGSLGYVRLHGRNARDWFRSDAGRDARYDYLYSRDELAEWRERIQRLLDGERDVYVITNNHFQGKAVVNALELSRVLLGRRAVVPAPLLTRYPRLADCADPDGPTQLRLL